MAIPLILAMTGAEISKKTVLPPFISWMACHFSPYGTGLTNLPDSIPPGSMVIVNDRTPVCGHDPELILHQLSALIEETQCSSILLDFQRPDEPQTAAITDAIVNGLPCPVGVSEPYARGHSCPVFLPPVPPHIPLAEYAAPWEGREVWLEAALDASRITVTPDGSTIVPLSGAVQSDACHHDSELCCHYHMAVQTDRIQFHLYRTWEDLKDLLAAAEKTVITKAIGLYQELK